MRKLLQRKVRVLKNKFYLYKGQLIRVLSFNAKENRVVVYQYSEGKKLHIEFDTAPLFLLPLFKIGEVAKFLQRSPETLRRYETHGYIPRASQYSLGRSKIRLYNENDLMELADFFAMRAAPGRPTVTNSKIDRVHLKKTLETRLKEI